MKKRYVETRAGQMHVRQWGTDARSDHPPIVLIHPFPFSGLSFEPLGPLLATDRAVFALDLPGYGASEPLKSEPTITGYSVVVADGIRALQEEGLIQRAVDVLGFQSGTFVAAELSLIDPRLVRRLALIDIPYLNPIKRREVHGAATLPTVLSKDVRCIEDIWQKTIAPRLGGEWENHAQALLSEALKGGDRSTWGFHAAFTYRCRQRFALVRHAVLAIATGSPLMDSTRQASELLPTCHLHPLPTVISPAIETGTRPLVKATRAFFDAARNHDEAVPEALRAGNHTA